MFVPQILPKKLSVVVFGSPFLFLKFLIHFSRFLKILLAGVKHVKLSIKCFFSVYDRTHQYVIIQLLVQHGIR